MSKKNIIIGILLGAILVVLLILIVNAAINQPKEDITNKEENKEEINVEVDNNKENIENDYVDNEDKNEENNNPKYLTQLPQFEDDFEKAMFIYSWFYDNSTLRKFVDEKNKVESGYYLLMIDGIKSIDDMKKYAYEVFDNQFIDKKFNEFFDNETPMIKNSQLGVIVHLGYVAQYSYDMGYSTYQRIENNDGTITYKVNLKESIMGDDYGCDITYEYKMEKNSEGRLVFKTFEIPATICLNDANSN